MKAKGRKRLKNILLVNLILVLSGACVANSAIFELPATFLAKTIGKSSAIVVMPQGLNGSVQKATTTVTMQSESIEKETKTKSESQTTANTTNETALANAEGVGGRILSQTIDKSGATMSYGDVYVRNVTDVSFNVKEELNNAIGLKIKLNSDEPQVLLVHTHATEAFFPTLGATYKSSWSERNDDTEKNMVAVGKVVKNALNKAGINTVQSTTLHDQGEYNGSYDRSRATIQKYLKKYPSIKVVLDLHRDAINEDDGDKIRPIISVDGKQAGQIMIINGCQTGSITGYKNWRKNLRFGLKLQNALEKKYPSFARPLFFAEKKYNQDLCVNSVLVEIGSQANLITEAKYSAQLFSNVLIKLLKSYS